MAASVRVRGEVWIMDSGAVVGISSVAGIFLILLCGFKARW